MIYYFTKITFHQLQELIPGNDTSIDYSKLHHLKNWQKFFQQYNINYTESSDVNKPNHFGAVEFSSEKHLTFLALANPDLYNIIIPYKERK